MGRGLARLDAPTLQTEGFQQLKPMALELALLGVPGDVVVQDRVIVTRVVEDCVRRLTSLERGQSTSVLPPPRQAAKARGRVSQRHANQLGRIAKVGFDRQ